MTTAEATEYCQWIGHRGLRMIVIADLITGRSYVCPHCEQIANTDNGCFPCNEKQEAAQCAAYDEQMANAESAYGCDPYARF